MLAGRIISALDSSSNSTQELHRHLWYATEDAIDLAALQYSYHDDRHVVASIKFGARPETGRISTCFERTSRSNPGPHRLVGL